jgi:hypothetical protein
MALSSSMIKIAERKSLYFNKFSYRVQLKLEGLYYTYQLDNINDFRELVEKLAREYDRYYYRRQINMNSINYELIGKYLDFVSKYKRNKNMVTVRHEGSSVCIYANELEIISEVLDFSPDSEVIQVVPMPAGVIQFKKDPPAAYRIYCKSSTHPGSIRQELSDYLERTPDMVPNSVLKRKLEETRPNVYFNQHTYFDYNDDRNILMMHLSFPGLLGKSYKLEKKPS